MIRSIFHVLVGHLCIFFGEKSVCLNPLPIFQSGDFFFFWVVGVLYISWTLPLIRLMICKCFLSCHRLPIHSVDCVLWCPEVLNFDSLVYYIFFFCCLCFWHHIQEIIVKSTLSSALNEWLCHLLNWEMMSPAPVPQSSFSLSVGEGSPSYPLPTPSLEEKLEMNRWWWPRKREIANQRGSGWQWPVGSLALDL